MVEFSDFFYEDDGEMMDDVMVSMDIVIVCMVIGRCDDDVLWVCVRRIVDVLFIEGLEKCVE